MNAFRVDQRIFEAGDRVVASGRYCADIAQNHPERVPVEEVLRRVSSAVDRCTLLHVFAYESDARDFWTQVPSSRLYAVHIDESDVMHRGDMRIVEELFATIRAGAAPEALARAYWNGDRSESPQIECLVRSAVVTACLEAGEAKRRAAKRRRWGLPDLPRLGASE